MIGRPRQLLPVLLALQVIVGLACSAREFNRTPEEERIEVEICADIDAREFHLRLRNNWPFAICIPSDAAPGTLDGRLGAHRLRIEENGKFHFGRDSNAGYAVCHGGVCEVRIEAKTEVFGSVPFEELELPGLGEPNPTRRLKYFASAHRCKGAGKSRS